MQQLQQHLQDLFGGKGQFTSIPEIPLELFLLDENTCDSPFSPEQVDRIWQSMPYWAFVWSSGAALAKYILDHPQSVQGLSVLDFGSGSGVVGLAALKAGAKQAVLCDIDELALKAGRLNAEHNGLQIQVCRRIEEANFDMLVVGDILYDTRNHGLANTLFSQDKPLLWAESQAQTKLAHQGPVAEYAGETQPNIGGFDEHKTIHIYQHNP